MYAKAKQKNKEKSPKGFSAGFTKEERALSVLIGAETEDMRVSYREMIEAARIAGKLL